MLILQGCPVERLILWAITPPPGSAGVRLHSVAFAWSQTAPPARRGIPHWKGKTGNLEPANPARAVTTTQQQGTPG